jgi:hypothetical protein
MNGTGRPPLRLVARLALAAAVLWSLVILVLGFTLPVYGQASTSSTIDASGETTTTVESTLTLVAANGTSAVVVLLVPLVASVAVALLLILGGDVARKVAWVLAILLTVLCVLGLMSIGLFVVPAAVALLVACTSARASAIWDTGLGAPAT